MTRKTTSFAVIVLLFTLALVGSSCSKTEDSVQPNFLFIFTDDQCYDDLSLHGNLHLETPNIDQLASEGVEFTNFHAAPLCAPSRAELLTGRNFLRTGVWGVHVGHDYMNLDETTFAEVLQDNGYTTAMWGKWHSGHTDAWAPWSRGFDHAWVSELYHHGDCRLTYNGAKLHPGGWATDTVTTMAIEFMEEHKEGPFFCYLPYMSPHGQWRAPERYVKKYMDRGQSLELATVNAMIEQIDDNVGRLMDFLEQSGLAENTIVIFTSDNGPTQFTHGAAPNRFNDEDWARRNPSRLRGAKGTVWENGTRVPFFVRWPGKYKPAKVDRNASLMDMFPTILDLAGVDVPADNKPLDGVSLKGLFEGDLDSWEDRLIFIPKDEPYWPGRSGRSDVLPAKDTIVYENQVLSVRNQDYKLVKSYNGYHLFHIPNDPREENNIIEEHPEVAERLKQELKNWHAGIMASESSYTLPRFRIGEKDVDETKIYACAAVSTIGHVKGGTLSTSNWLRAGDGQMLHVEVLEAGSYEFSMEARLKNPRARVELWIGDRKLSARLDSDAYPVLGIMELEPGQYDLELRILEADESDQPVFDRVSGIWVKKLKLQGL